MEGKIVGTSEDEKRFLQISMDPSDNKMLKADVRFIPIPIIMSTIQIEMV